MDKSLHDLVENYAKSAQKNATQEASKIGHGASRRSQFWAPGVSPFSAAFWRMFGVAFNQIVQRFVHPQYYDVSKWLHTNRCEEEHKTQ